MLKTKAKEDLQMEENKGTNQDPNTEVQEQDKAPENNGGDKSDQMIPKSRFDDVNSKYKELKEELDKIQEAQNKKEIDDKVKQGEFEKLYNDTMSELDTFKSNHTKASEKAQALEGVVNELVEAKLQNIPEEFHDLVPNGMSAEQKLSWLNQAESKGLFTNKKTETPLGGNTNPGSKQNSDLSKLSPMELLKAAYSSRK